MKKLTKRVWHCKLALVGAMLLLAGTLSGQSTDTGTSASKPAESSNPSALHQSTDLTNPGATVQPKSPSPGSGTSGSARSSEAISSSSGGSPNHEESQVLHVVMGRSVFLNTPDRLRRVYVSNPAVIDSMTTSPHELVITAKTAGTSSLVVWSEGGQSIVYTVLADVDLGGLRESLAEALPGEHIMADAQGTKVFLSGTVGSDAAAEAATKLATVYSKEVVNSLVIDPRHRPQVQLKVHFAELDRSKLTQFGINLLSVGNHAGAGTTGQFSPPGFSSVGGGGGSATISDVLNLFYFNTPNGVGVTVKDLQTKGILEILAEPNLMTLDGVPAKFLAGGEFPYPMIQPGSGGGTATVTVQFRPYGVKLEFTPYVNRDGSIRLKVAPEVSSLDYSNVVVIAGYTLPALSVRKAETEIELRNGQSFGISGILDRRTTDNLSKVPGIGDIPILGQLFRSKNLNSSVMELVVVVTPTIVDPLSNPENGAPADPGFLVQPGHLGSFDHGLPKDYVKK